MLQISNYLCEEDLLTFFRIFSQLPKISMSNMYCFEYLMYEKDILYQKHGRLLLCNAISFLMLDVMYFR